VLHVKKGDVPLFCSLSNRETAATMTLTRARDGWSTMTWADGVLLRGGSRMPPDESLVALRLQALSLGNVVDGSLPSGLRDLSRTIVEYMTVFSRGWEAIKERVFFLWVADHDQLFAALPRQLFGRFHHYVVLPRLGRALFATGCHGDALVTNAYTRGLLERGMPEPEVWRLLAAVFGRAALGRLRTGFSQAPTVALYPNGVCGMSFLTHLVGALMPFVLYCTEGARTYRFPFCVIVHGIRSSARTDGRPPLVLPAFTDAESPVEWLCLPELTGATRVTPLPREGMIQLALSLLPLGVLAWRHLGWLEPCQAEHSRAVLRVASVTADGNDATQDDPDGSSTGSVD